MEDSSLQVEVENTEQKTANPLDWRATGKLEAEELEARQRIETERLRRIYNEVAASDAGREMLRHVMNLCNFKTPNLVLVNGSPDMAATMYNEARRGVYIQMRQYIRPDNLNRIEREAQNENNS